MAPPGGVQVLRSVLGVAGVLALVLPQPIGPAANRALEVTKPAFFFYWLYPFEDRFGVNGILHAAIAFFALLVLVPFIDRTPLRALRARKVVFLSSGALALGHGARPSRSSPHRPRPATPSHSRARNGCVARRRRESLQEQAST